MTGQRADPAVLRRYDTSEARRKHMIAVRRFLEVKSFDGAGKALLGEALGEAALTKEDVVDIINVGIEILVRHRYELPAFGTLVREARARRAATNQTLHRQVHLALNEAGAAAIDALFTVGDDPRRVSPWHDLKQDAAKPTVHGLRELLARHEKLARWAEYTTLLHTIPVVKATQWALEGNSLDAASMADLALQKRYAVALALIRQRLARVTDDLCEILCKQMSRVTHAAEDVAAVSQRQPGQN